MHETNRVARDAQLTGARGSGGMGTTPARLGKNQPDQQQGSGKKKKTTTAAMYFKPTGSGPPRHPIHPSGPFELRGRVWEG